MIIDGRALAQQLNQQTAERVKTLPFVPVLCDVVVGEDLPSLSYVKIKQRNAQSCGLKFELIHLATATTDEVVAAVVAAQANPDLCGLIVQLPLPAGLDQVAIVTSIAEKVDVDLLNPASAEKFYKGAPSLVPPTAGAIMHMLDSLEVNLKDLGIVVAGQGELVGKPVTHLLKQRGYRVQAVDENTDNRESLIAQADVLITGVGKASLIKFENVQEGVIIIDAGTSESGGSITGDVDFENVAPKARFITPVPGGVGPVTVAKLLENVVLVAERGHNT
jgi:methylenetetrahydrofolate dehydrogenase (NADP+) / methenyltetrahydrofolate cyclohydrolase